MEKGLINITLSATDQTLIEKNARSGGVKSISMCNTHASTACTADVWLEDSAGTPNKSYFVKGTSIPGTVTLQLDNISFDNNALALKAKFTSGSIDSSNPISIIIK